MRLLLTRPRSEAAAMAERLGTLGHECLIEPLLEIVPTGMELTRIYRYQAVLVTSGNAADALAAATRERDVLLLAVGSGTAARLAAHGFTEVVHADGNAGTLADLVRDRLVPDDGALLYAAGANVSGDLQGMLTRAGYSVDRAVLYRAEPASSLSPETRAALSEGRIDGILLMSARSAAVLGGLVRDAGLAMSLAGTTAYCISAAVASAAAALPWRAVAVAARPRAEDVLALLPHP